MNKLILITLAIFMLASCTKETQVSDQISHELKEIFDLPIGTELTQEQAALIGYVNPNYGNEEVKISERTTHARSANSIWKRGFKRSKTCYYYKKNSSGNLLWQGSKSGTVHSWTLPSDTYFNCTFGGGTPGIEWFVYSASSPGYQVAHQYYDGSQGCWTPVVNQNNTPRFAYYGVFPGGLASTCGTVRTNVGNCP